MATMVLEVYDAFRSIGADEPHARAAAEAFTAPDIRFDKIESLFDRLDTRFTAIDARFVALEGKNDTRSAAVDARFSSVDAKISELRGDFGERCARMDGRMALMTWMLGFLLASMVTVIFKLFLH